MPNGYTFVKKKHFKNSQLPPGHCAVTPSSSEDLTELCHLPQQGGSIPAKDALWSAVCSHKAKPRSWPKKKKNSLLVQSPPWKTSCEGWQHGALICVLWLLSHPAQQCGLQSWAQQSGKKPESTALGSMCSNPGLDDARQVWWNWEIWVNSAVQRLCSAGACSYVN